MSMAIAMYIAFLFLATWLPAEWKRRAVGYGLLTDISVHVVLQGLFGGDAAGRVGLLLAGVMINATLHLYRRVAGWEKLTFDGWVRYDGKGVVIFRPKSDTPDPAPTSTT